MGWEEGVEEGFMVGTPPLREAVTDVPFQIGRAGVCRRKAGVQEGCEGGEFFRLWREVVAWSVCGLLVDCL